MLGPVVLVEGSRGQVLVTSREGDQFVAGSDRLMVASLNTRGMPVRGSQLPARYRAIAETLEETKVDVVALQEVHTHYHLRQLTQHMPSFGSVSYRPTLAGPAGGLVTLSRTPVRGHTYRRFPTPSACASAGLPPLTRVKASLKGTLVAALTDVPVCIVNTHPLANFDGDWSPTNRYFWMHREQLAALTGIVEAVRPPVVVCGDFNIARDSELLRDFIAGTGLTDTFQGRCPATFHHEYLGPGKTPQCIDFLLTSPTVKVEATQLLFPDKVALPGGPSFVSDHIGLAATVIVPV